MKKTALCATACKRRAGPALFLARRDRNPAAPAPRCAVLTHPALAACDVHRKHINVTLPDGVTALAAASTLPRHGKRGGWIVLAVSTPRSSSITTSTGFAALAAARRLKKNGLHQSIHGSREPGSSGIWSLPALYWMEKSSGRSTSRPKSEKRVSPGVRLSLFPCPLHALPAHRRFLPILSFYFGLRSVSRLISATASSVGIWRQ